MYYYLYVSLPFYVSSSVSLPLPPPSLSLSPDEVTMLVPSLLFYDPIDSEWVWSMSHPI